jgi:hypothetical protein
MIFKLRLGKLRITFTIAPVTQVIGVNSILPDGNHILMWDFDDIPLSRVEENLAMVQQMFGLPNIYIFNSGKPNHWIAYCFKRLPWPDARGIIGITPDIDENFYKYGVYRGKFTLRVSPKCGRKPKLVKVLESDIPEDVDISELRSWVQYETLPDNYKSRLIQIPPKSEK